MARLNKIVPLWQPNIGQALPPRLLEFDRNHIASEIRPFLVDGYSITFLVRMLFSCLVDADYLTTEKFMSKERTELRNNIPLPSIESLAIRLHVYMEKKRQMLVDEGKAKRSINRIREEIRRDCIERSREAPGLFTLTVPTGGGKTLSSLAFALEHARQHGLERVIYVIPYTSIIEQNAQVFVEALGENAVLEHHSNMDEGAEDTRTKLATENWDSRVIVTTSVQFFESLHSHKPSRCRKLHRLAKSVVILDEAQTLPVELLRPCLRALDELIIRFGSSVVICTATQPAIMKKHFDIGLSGNTHGCREIIDRGRDLHNRLQRTTARPIPGKLSDIALIERLLREESFLAIVNTRRHARDLYERVKIVLPDNLFHLSAQMCPEHRNEIFDVVRDRLKRHLPCRVVSTQLIEAGVDVDFPCVYRAMAGVDSIAQAAGRCNREGTRSAAEGRVFVFDSAEHPAPPGFLRIAAQAGAHIIALPKYASDIMTPEAVTQYFNLLYWTQIDKTDIFTVCSDLIPPSLPHGIDDFLCYQFRTLGENFRFIAETSAPIIVPYGNKGEALCEALRSTYAPDELRRLMRQLQRFTVSVPRPAFDEAVRNHVVEMVHGRYPLLISTKTNYSPEFGVVLTVEGTWSFLGI